MHGLREAGCLAAQFRKGSNKTTQEFSSNHKRKNGEAAVAAQLAKRKYALSPKTSAVRDVRPGANAIQPTASKSCIINQRICVISSLLGKRQNITQHGHRARLKTSGTKPLRKRHPCQELQQGPEQSQRYIARGERSCTAARSFVFCPHLSPKLRMNSDEELLSRSIPSWCSISRFFSRNPSVA